MNTTIQDVPPYLVVTDDVKGPNLWIVTLLSLSLSVAALLARAFAKHKFQLKPTPDDAALVVAIVRRPLLLSLCEHVFLTIATEFGCRSIWSRHCSPD
jgi:hypothetical protein